MRSIRELLNITGAREKTRAVICSAIRNRHLIEFYYHGGYRTVEPFCLGLVISGGVNNESLLCYQTAGFSDLREVVGWKLYRASEMQDIEVLDECFGGDRPGYDPDVVDMVKIYCCVTPVAGAAEAAAEDIAAMPRFEPPADTPPPGDFNLKELPEVEPLLQGAAAPEVARSLTHNELMRIFRLNHPALISTLYRIIFSGPAPVTEPLSEHTGWELRHFLQMFEHLCHPERAA